MNKKVRVWLAPTVVGIASLAGLLVALFADGFVDLISIAMLSVPVALCIWLGYIKR